MKQSVIRRAAIAALAAITACCGSASAAPPAAAVEADPPRYERALPEAEVLIDVGHGGIDGGAHFGDVLEKDINLAVAKRLYLMLRSRGVAAVLNRTGDYALSEENRWHLTRSRHRRDLSQRRKLAEEIPVRMLVSIHVNWSGSSRAHGPLVLHQREGGSALLAGLLQDGLNRVNGTSARPRIGKPYYLLNTVKMPSVIVELGFLSNPADRMKLTNPRHQQRIAEAMAEAIRLYGWTVE